LTIETRRKKRQRTDRGEEKQASTNRSTRKRTAFERLSVVCGSSCGDQPRVRRRASPVRGSLLLPCTPDRLL
jgi:hypothetical protein